MGWLKDSFSNKVDGHDIVVEVRSGPVVARFALKVDGEVQDIIKAFTGNHWLEGALPGPGGADDAARPFRVRVNLKAGGLGGETYWIEIDGEETKFGEGFIL